MRNGLVFKGAIPAHLLPFTEDFQIAEKELRRHVKALADIPGVEAIVSNGHASEVASCSPDEQRQVLRIVKDEVGSRVKIISSVLSDDTRQAVQLAKNAKADGADGLLVFPLSTWWLGCNFRPDMALRFFSVLGEVGLPMVVFQYPIVGTKFGYDTDLLVNICRLPNVAGVKEWSQDIVTFERNTRLIQELDKPVAVLSSFSASLYATYLLGADGSISGMGSVVADWQTQMFAAVQKGDLATASAINKKHFALGNAFYRTAFVDMHNRMKEALVMLGRLDRAVVREPLLRISDEDRSFIRKTLIETGLLAK
jgi:4-hydroxy-tetrahydrodipicolinate synthase